MVEQLSHITHNESRYQRNFFGINESAEWCPTGYSVLGPLLFLLYVNELPKCIKCDMKMYADDTIALV